MSSDAARTCPGRVPGRQKPDDHRLVDAQVQTNDSPPSREHAERRGQIAEETEAT